ncbi:MAG: hypothetical protein B0D92_02930 [Spirochaeta sp. LUC14_002_19_P3]|nr:MAG: hypothetical protein B0D92_02930 [Spirochaeta sp. LUC14_002_19_P3]
MNLSIIKNLSKKTLREFIVLGAIALSCILYISFRERGDINYTLPAIPKLSIDDFTALEVHTPNGEIVKMEKGGGQWTLSGGYPADATLTERILETLSAPKPIDLVSQAGSYARYELDEEGRYSIKGLKDGNLLRELHLGKVSDSNKYNYVIFPGYKGVYTIRGTLSSTLAQEPESFRSKKVMEINTSTITEISYSTDELTTTLNKDEESNWQDQNGEAWDSAKINELVGRFTAINASGFPESAPSRSQELARISLKGETSPTITLYEKTDQGYPADFSTYPFPVIISDYLGDSIIKAFEEAE